MSSEAFSESSAQDTRLAAEEAREWIEAVTGKKFKNDSIRESLEDGVLLCELMNKVNPGVVKKINKSKSPIAYLDNIRQFLNGCQDLGMKDAQLFDTMDLQAKGGRRTGVKRNEADRRIRGVCITLFWLGRTVAELNDYSGPQLDLELFKRLMEGKLSDGEGEDEGVVVDHKVVVVDHKVVVPPKCVTPVVNQDNHFPVQEEARSPTPTAVSNDSITTGSSQENGLNLTFEQEQTADELLADIQNAVDEMLENFQFSPVTKNSPQPVPPKPSKKPDVKSNVQMLNGTSAASQVPSTDHIDGEEGVNHQDHVHVVKMHSRNGGFGFQVMGGMDSNIPAQVDYIVPGSAAEESGLEVGDILTNVNGQDVSNISHADLVGAIKKAGSTGEVILGVKRDMNISDMTDHTHTEEPSHRHFSRNESFDRWEEENKERMRQAEEIALLYPQRNGGAIDMGGSNDPPASYNREPLETLVEHQEEAMFEQLEEMVKVSSPPHSAELLPSSVERERSHSETPPMNQSPYTPTSPIHDDKESIEREIRELELMAAEDNHAREDSLSNSTNEETDDDADKKTVKIVADSGPVKLDSFEVTESRSPLPMSPISEPVQVEVRQTDARSPRYTPTQPLPPPLDDILDTNGLLEDPVLSLEKQMDELIKLTASTSAKSLRGNTTASPPPASAVEKVVMPPPVDFSSVPPKPTAVAPKRAKRPAPPPPKNKPKKSNQFSAETAPSVIWIGSPLTTKESDSTPEFVPPASPGQAPTNTSQSPTTQHIPSPSHTTSPQPVISMNGAAIIPASVIPAISPQERAISPQERTISPQERTISPQERTISPQEPAISPQEPAISPQEPAFSPQEPAISPQEPAISPQEPAASLQDLAISPQEPVNLQEPAVSPHREPTATSPQEHSTRPKEPSTSPRESSVTIPEPVPSDLFSSPLRSPSPLQDTFLTSSLLRSDSPDLLTQMQELAFSKNIASGLAGINGSNEGPTSSYHTGSYRPDKTSQPELQREQAQPSTHFSKSPNKPNSDSSLKLNGPVAVVAPPINTKLIGSNSPDGGELSGGIKIQRVQKTRWTPRSNSHEQSPAHTPDQVVPSLTPQHHQQDTASAAMSHEDRSATLPNMRRHKVSPSRDRRGQDQAGAPVARGIGITGGIGMGQDTKRGVVGQPRSNSNPYQPHNLQQAWKSQEELRNQRINPGVPSVKKKATTPDGTKAYGVQPSNSFSQGPIDNRRNRSKTWSAQAVQDGYQVVYSVTPNNPYDLCSRCHQPLGQDNILSVPALRTQYHKRCLMCRVCKTPLGLGGKSTKILMKNKQPHCKFCGSSDGNTLTTEC